jgi:DNA (cytosine-5)-methyltransferase 1
VAFFIAEHTSNGYKTTMVYKTAIDLFCGAGGLSEGFRQAGFKIVAGNDFNETAGRTFAATHLDAEFVSGPIQDLKAKRLLSLSGLARGELDCLIGGPPCQGFSVYNHQRGMHDHRSQLFHEYLRLVDGLQPKWIVMENVTGILSAGGGQAVKDIQLGLGELGYNVEQRTLRAEEYGVPQERRRVIFIGTRINAEIRFPEPTHGPDMLPYVTIKDAIADLPVLQNGGSIPASPYRKAARSDFQRMTRERSALIHSHHAPKLSTVNLERMKHIPPGGSWRDIPVSLLPEGMKRAHRSDHTKRYGRMTWDGLACTILTKCDVHWGAYIHPEQDRAISVREAARLQSFPDWFQFEGSMTDQYVQIGNAVPPVLGKAIAKGILDLESVPVKGRQAAKAQALVEHADL